MVATLSDEFESEFEGEGIQHMFFICLFVCIFFFFKFLGFFFFFFFNLRIIGILS